jgi:MOSC domain-containing protein YiiM
VGQPREIQWLGHTWQTAIWKTPVAGPIAVRGVNLDGDDQADRSVHGGEDKAVYAYAREDASWWEEQLGQPVGPGTFGENLTLEGIDVTHAVVGELWAIGSAMLSVTQPRIPCFKLGARIGDASFPTAFADAGRPGAYLAIVQEGEIRAEDPVRLVERPAHGITVGEIADIYHHHDAAERLLEAPGVPTGWRAWAAKMVQARARAHRRSPAQMHRA